MKFTEGGLKQNPILLFCCYTESHANRTETDQ
jgi:hypothetical protein